MKVLLTGGHLTPALALIDHAHSQHLNMDFVWVGRGVTQTSTGQKSREELEANQRSVPFFALATAKLEAGSWLGINDIEQLWRASKKVFKLLQKEKPNVYVSFGGYLSLPTAMACWRLGIPIVIHEQTRQAGLANRWMALLAHHVFAADETALRYFPRHKTSIIGNLLRHSILSPYPTPPVWLPKVSPTLPILYVAGGSQGSLAINKMIIQLLPWLLTQFQVIHQCGPNSSSQRPLEECLEVKHHLPKADQAKYVVREWLEETELNWVLHHGWAYLGRAGANTVWEIAAIGLPSIFIPLPNARNQEQFHNAAALAHAGAAIILPQADATPEKIKETLAHLSDRYTQFYDQAQAYARSIPQEGVAVLSQYLQQFAS